MEGGWGQHDKHLQAGKRLIENRTVINGSPCPAGQGKKGSSLFCFITSFPVSRIGCQELFLARELILSSWIISA